MPEEPATQSGTSLCGLEGARETSHFDADDAGGTTMGEDTATSREEILRKIVGQAVSERLFMLGTDAAAYAMNDAPKISEANLPTAASVAGAASDLLQPENDEVLVMLIRKRDVLQAQLRILEQRLQQ